MSGWKKPIDHNIRYVLFPLAMLYWGVLFWRNLFYNLGFFVSKKLPAKVISVGNITTGGTGKTPAVIYLAKALLKKGKRVAILSRGYGRQTAGTQLVTDGKTQVSDWRNFGDEPTLISKALSGVPVVVDEKRHRGGMFLVDKFNPDIIILDDAFQHRSIERDVDIVLINSQDNRADHKLLPYGFLREPWVHLKRAHVLIFTKTNLKKPAPFLRSIARNSKAHKLKSVFVQKHFVSPKGQKKNILNRTKILAVSAVGDHRGFVQTLINSGLEIVDEIAYIDHHDYSQKDIEEIQRRFLKSDAEFVITTEKDMIKIDQLKLSGLEIYSMGIEFKLNLKAEKQLLDIILKEKQA